MFRYVVLPGAVLMLVGIGAFSYSLWDIFHQQFMVVWNPVQAYDGDLETQRHLAMCYRTGCTSVPRDPASACAWRQIIATERKHASTADVTALHNACGHLSAVDRRLIKSLENDIQMKMREQKEKSLSRS